MMATKVPGFFALDLLDNRFPALHGMRVLAILSVIAYHVSWIFMAEQGIMLDPGFFTQALAIFFGMDLFFLLSGFLIGSHPPPLDRHDGRAAHQALLSPAHLPHLPVLLPGPHLPRRWPSG